MSQTVVIYENTLTGRVPLARLVQDESGHTEFLPFDDPDKFRFIKDMLDGTLLLRGPGPPKEVRPDDGEDYLKAVFSELASSTYYSAVREPEPADRSEEPTVAVGASAPAQPGAAEQVMETVDQAEQGTTEVPQDARPQAGQRESILKRLFGRRR